MHLHAGLACLVVGVRDVQGVVEKKRLPVIIADKLQRIGGEQIRRIIHALHRHAAAGHRLFGILHRLPTRRHLVAQFFHLAVADEKFRIKIVRMPHVDVAVKMVEPHVVGVGEIIRRAHAPFANARRAITRALEH